MWLKKQNMIKEALDNLSMAISFFDENGTPLLVNHTMHELVFLLNGCDLQNISELDCIMAKPDEIHSKDGRVWRFYRRELDEMVTEITAADITELYQKKRELMESCAEQKEIMERLETVSANVVSITRSEEILSMKMKLHNDLDYAISSTRRFISGEFSENEKREYIKKQREMARGLLAETTGDDEPDIFAELKRSAKKLGMEIVFDGEMPESVENLMTRLVRECLINAVRHAGGDRVFVRAKLEDTTYKATITNNGATPQGEIIEGGGLSSLRKNIEDMGGSMKIECLPEFTLTVEIPVIRGENND